MISPYGTRLLAAAATLLSGGLSSCTDPKWQTHTVEPEVAVAAMKHRWEYTLAAGEKIDVIVVNHPVISRSCDIRSDGYISLPLVDDVKAAGLTPKQLDQELTELLSSRLRDPEVTVVVTSVRPPSVAVVGEVVRSTIVPLSSAPTAAEAVAMAGGFTNTSAERRVIVLRATDDGPCVGLKVDVSGLRGRLTSRFGASRFNQTTSSSFP
jgi:polysaccharide export outer membrane protein